MKKSLNTRLYLDLNKANPDKRYTIMRWNEKYGDNAVFVLRDNQKQLYTVYTPKYPGKVGWTKERIYQKVPYKNWDDFNGETFHLDDYRDILM